MPLLETEYIFTLPDGAREVFRLEMDESTFQLANTPEEPLPGWVELGCCQCPNCPLRLAEHRRCPMAAALVPIVRRLDTLLSWDTVRVEVVSGGRYISQETSAQRGIGSMIGLLNAASGCPHLAFFRPMARVHLPFCSREETVYRVTSMYLLAQYFRWRDGDQPDFSLAGLEAIYREIRIVNAAFVERLRLATAADSMANALVFLDLYAVALQQMIADSLEGVRHYFAPYLTAQDLRPRPAAPENGPSLPPPGPAPQ